MRFHPWLLPASLALLAVALTAVACGGSGEDRRPPDFSGIPTATLPNPLPEPLIVGEIAPTPRGTAYVVQDGDSLSSLAARFGTTVEAIAEANGISDPTRLEVGQALIILGAAPEEIEDVLDATAEPAVEPTVEPTVTPEPQEPVEPTDGTIYTVQSGDIAAEIAERFGITLEELAAANNTTVDDLRSLSIGDELLIPGSTLTATPEPPEPEEPAEPTDVTIYTVQSGDIAAEIAERFGITLEELAVANNTTVDDLRSLNIGDDLLIPAAAPAATPEP